MTKKHERTYARCLALQLLYRSEIMGSQPEDIAENLQTFVESGSLEPYAAQIVSSDIDNSAVIDYAEVLVRGVDEHADDINTAIDDASDNWAIDRMPCMDRAILRIAVLEMNYMDEVPVSVAINEAVDLAKEYGGEDDSSRFVNGILGRIARTDQQDPVDANNEQAPKVDADAAEDSKVEADV